MIDKISYYVSAKPGELATFMTEITDHTLANFRVSLIGNSKYMFFPSLLMAGVVAMEHRDADSSVVAVKVKNQLEEKMIQSGLHWIVIRDSDTEVALMIEEETEIPKTGD